MKKKTPKSCKLRDLICLFCKRNFQNYCPPSNLTKTCSMKCKSKLNGLKKKNGYQIKCNKCSKYFYARPSDIKKNRKYCSMRCTRNDPNLPKGIYISSDGYYCVSSGEKLHRVIMERHIGRKLSIREIVHHINDNKLDNRIENLQIMSRAEHNRHHLYERYNRCKI